MLQQGYMKHIINNVSLQSIYYVIIIAFFFTVFIPTFPICDKYSCIVHIVIIWIKGILFGDIWVV